MRRATDNLPADLAGSTAPASMGTLAKVAQSIINAVKGRDARIKSLEARISELERQPFKYMGVFTEGTDYAKGMFVSHGGSMWHCNFETCARPGKGGYDWTLCVKHGRDVR